MSCGARTVLLAGDAGTITEPRWSAQLESAGAAAVLKVGHHGSASATGGELLRALTPRHAIITVGARNPFGLPRTEVLQRLRRSGIAVYRTDRDGAVHVSLGRRIRVRAERWRAGTGR